MRERRRQLTQGLRFRISAAFLVVGLVLSTLAVNAVDYVMDIIEARYVEATLMENLEMVVAQRRQNPAFALPYSKSLRAYVVSGGNEATLPPYLRGLAPGIQEREPDGRELQIAVRDEGAYRHIMTFDVTSLDRVEDGLDLLLLGGVVIFTGLSLWLGYWGSGRVIAPVRSLAREVRSLGQQISTRETLTGRWGDDEVGELARAFEQYAQRLQAFVQREKAFTADVSHELRNPIMVASSTLDLMLEHSRLEPDDVRLLHRLRRAVTRMSELVDVCLTLARERSASSGRVETGEPLDLEGICREILSRHADRAERKGLTVRLDVQGSPAVVGSSTAARVVIENLLANAIRQTPAGSVLITIDEGGIDISDSGPGIIDAEAGRIYDREFRGSHASGPGFGLGLNIVKRLCEHNRWAVRLRNAEAGGAVAEFRFSPSH